MKLQPPGRTSPEPCRQAVRKMLPRRYRVSGTWECPSPAVLTDTGQHSASRPLMLDVFSRNPMYSLLPVPFRIRTGAVYSATLLSDLRGQNLHF